VCYKPDISFATDTYRDKATAARHLFAIEALGFIERRRGQDDEREKHVFLTKEGKKLMGKIIKLVQKILLRAQEGVNPRDVATCKDVLRCVHKNLG